MALWRRVMHIPKLQHNTTSMTQPTCQSNFAEQQRPDVLTVGCAQGAKFSLYDCLVPVCNQNFNSVDRDLSVVYITGCLSTNTVFDNVIG